MRGLDVLAVVVLLGGGCATGRAGPGSPTTGAERGLGDPSSPTELAGATGGAAEGAAGDGDTALGDGSSDSAANGSAEGGEAFDVRALASSEAIVFLRVGERCEAWQFVDGGARLERTDDESLGLVLSFAVGVRGADALTLTDPRASSRGEATQLECPEGEARKDLLYAEEADCEAQRRPAIVKAGCPDALLSEDQRGAALHRLEAERAAILTARVDAAPDLLKRFRGALRRHKAIYWRQDDGSCERWDVRKNTLVHQTDGGRTEYELATTLDARTGLARIDLSGPGFIGKDGSSSGIGDYQQLTLTDVTETHATVGPRRWYFTRSACTRA